MDEGRGGGGNVDDVNGGDLRKTTKTPFPRSFPRFFSMAQYGTISKTADEGSRPTVGEWSVSSPSSSSSKQEGYVDDEELVVMYEDEDGGVFVEDDEDEEEKHMYPSRTVKLLMAGGLAGVVSRTATAPLDRLKMLLQVNDAEKRMTMKEGLRYMAREGTIKSFFKGNGTNVIKIAPETAIKLTMNDIYKRMIASDVEEITPPQRMAAGALAGATSQAIIYPLELVKTRLAVCKPGMYSGIIDCARKVLAQEGARSFYRGLMPSMMGILPYAGVDITVFELMKERLLDEYDGMPPPHSILCAGMLSSSVAQFSAYPLALVRTRLQAQGIGGTPLKYNGMTDVLRKTYQKEGFRGLYKGSMTNLAKLAPAAGISWFVFEETKVLLGLSMRN